MGNELFMDASMLKNIKVESKDVVFIVYREDSEGNDYKHGELSLSQGGVVWRGRGDKKDRTLGWVSFDRMMQENASRKERRKPGTSRTVRKKVSKINI